MFCNELPVAKQDSYSNWQDDRSVLMTISTEATSMNLNGNKRLILFLDSGSTNSYIREKLVPELGLTVLQRGFIKLHTAGGLSTIYDSKTVEVALKKQDGELTVISVNTLPTICSGWEKVAFIEEDKEFVECLKLDIVYDFPELIIPDILIGVDLFQEIFTDIGTKLPSGRFLMQTIFGNVLAGKATTEKSCIENSSCLVAHRVEDMAKYLNQMTSLELLGITEPANLKADEVLNKDLETYYLRTVEVTDEDGVVLALPRIREHTLGGDNFELCANRFKKLILNPRNNRDKMLCYKSIFDEQLSRKIIEEVPLSEWRNPKDREWTYHIPWFAVVKDSVTTAVRPVLDASSKAPGCRSLNDCLYSGPVILPKLIALLFLARTSQYLVIAYVEKAFHMITLREADCDVTRFFWLRDVEEGYHPANVVMYRHRKLPFGLTSSPFLLGIGMMAAFKEDHPELAKLVKTGCYVDNCLFSVDTSEQVYSCYIKYKKAFEGIGMNLREFNSNDQTLLPKIPDSDRAKRSVDSKILGVRWNTVEDYLEILVKMAFLESPTKRKVVSSGSSTFDPLGISLPYLLSYKIFVQKLWQRSKVWDESLTGPETEEWRQICDSVHETSIKVPRVSLIWSNNNIEGFLLVDASKHAICCALYLRKQDSAGNYSVSLQMAKGKLAPLGPSTATIPRLELVGIFIAVNLIDYLDIHTELNWKRLVIMSDSQIALGQVRSRKVSNLFVTNRVRRIREVARKMATKCELEFGYVPTEFNSADIGTRGLKRADDNNMWLNGPAFLRKSQTEWGFEPELAKLDSYADMEFVNLAVRKALFVSTKKPPRRYFLLAEKSVDKELLERVCHISAKSTQRTYVHSQTGWKRVKSGYLRENETRLLLWERYQFFSQAITSLIRTQSIARNWKLSSEKPVENTETEPTINYQREKIRVLLIIQKESGISNLLSEHFGYPTTVDKYGLVRLRTRLGNILENDDDRPVIVDRFHPATDLIIRELHVNNKHASSNWVFDKFRSEFFCVAGLSVVKKCLARCFECKKRFGLPYRYPMSPDLPLERLTIGFPFENVGLDYAGPFEIKQKISEHGKSLEFSVKVWICLFTCLTTRGIHLEKADSLSTADFLLCFSKFISKRGVPKSIRTDNQPAFVLGSKLTQDNIEISAKEKLIWEKRNIQWKFISALSPWKGGHYEALVRSLKNVLKTEFTTSMSVSQFELLLAETMRIVNERPLTRVSDSLEYVRPIDLIEPNRHISGILGYNSDRDSDPDFNAVEVHEVIKNMLKVQDRKVETFWNRWKSSYLAQLKEQLPKSSVKVKSSGLSPQLNDFVLLMDKKLKREEWPVGIITNVILDTDGNCRSCQVRTATGLTIRATCMLIPLIQAVKSTSEPVVEPQLAKLKTKVVKLVRKAQYQGTYGMFCIHEMKPSDISLLNHSA